MARDDGLSSFRKLKRGQYVKKRFIECIYDSWFNLYGYSGVDDHGGTYFVCCLPGTGNGQRRNDRFTGLSRGYERYKGGKIGKALGGLRREVVRSDSRLAAMKATLQDWDRMLDKM